MFSPNETKVLKILGFKKMTINQIKEKFYGKTEPLYANIYIAKLVRNIVHKCDRARENWTIAGEGKGCTGKTVWIKESQYGSKNNLNKRN